jgi:tetratricopeptide (TPR) repeat protein
MDKLREILARLSESSVFQQFPASVPLIITIAGSTSQFLAQVLASTGAFASEVAQKISQDPAAAGSHFVIAGGAHLAIDLLWKPIHNWMWGKVPNHKGPIRSADDEEIKKRLTAIESIFKDFTDRYAKDEESRKAFESFMRGIYEHPGFKNDLFQELKTLKEEAVVAIIAAFRQIGDEYYDRYASLLKTLVEFMRSDIRNLDGKVSELISETRQLREEVKGVGKGVEKGFARTEAKMEKVISMLGGNLKNSSSLDKAESEKKIAEKDAEFARYAFENANKWYEKGEYSQSIEDLNRAIEKAPQFIEAHFNRGNAYGELGQHEKAMEDYDQSIALDPKDATAYNNRGNAYYNLKHYKRAIEDYNRAIALDPKLAGAYNNRGTAYGELGQHEKAMEDYDQSIALDPKDATAYNNRACAYSLRYGKDQREADRENALKDLKKAIELDPKYKEMAKRDTDFYPIWEDSLFQSLLS